MHVKNKKKKKMTKLIFIKLEPKIAIQVKYVCIGERIYRTVLTIPNLIRLL